MTPPLTSAEITAFMQRLGDFAEFVRIPEEAPEQYTKNIRNNARRIARDLDFLAGDVLFWLDDPPQWREVKDDA